MPVETRIVRWDDELMRAAILRELNRDGQIYFVHTRVSDIEQLAVRLRILAPEARVVVGHGQMAEGELEKAMVKFVRKEAEILVATTIIESGLDIPNANTRSSSTRPTITASPTCTNFAAALGDRRTGRTPT